MSGVNPKEKYNNIMKHFNTILFIFIIFIIPSILVSFIDNDKQYENQIDTNVVIDDSLRIDTMKIDSISMNDTDLICVEGYTYHKNEPFTDSSVYNLALSLGAMYPEVAVAIAFIESGNGKSRLARRQHNLFGMKVAKKRKTTQLKSKSKGYASYASWQESVIDFILWEKYRFKNKPSKDVYINKICKTYARDPHYKSKLNSYMKKFFNKQK